MGILSEEEKRELIEDAKSEERKRDFKILEKKEYKGFSLKFLEEISKILKVKYPRHIIKDEKNKL